jgi:hypothetical protein
MATSNGLTAAASTSQAGLCRGALFESFEIGLDDLEALTASVHRLRDVVEAISRERLETLREDAGI